jgi:hypothetical protein
MLLLTPKVHLYQSSLFFQLNFTVVKDHQVAALADTVVSLLLCKTLKDVLTEDYGEFLLQIFVTYGRS